MADLDFSVAMTGVQQAEKGLDTLAKKSDQVAKSEKMREKATDAANKATVKATAGNKSPAPTQTTGGRAARVFGKLGGSLGQASGLGEIGALGATFGPLAAGAVAVGAALKIFGASLQMANKLALERVAGIVKEAQMERQARDMQGQSGVRALETQGANLLRLESLGPAFTELAKSLTVARKGGTSFSAQDTQAAVLAASRGGAGVSDTRETVEAARRLATLSGQGLAESVKAIQEAGMTSGGANQAIATALSLLEDRRVTTADVSTREMYLRESATAGVINQGRATQARTGLAEQGNLGLSIETLTRQLIDVQAPLINLQADAFRENSIKLDALTNALSEQGAFWRIFDRLTNGVNSLSANVAQAQRDLTGGRTDPAGSIPLMGY
jgi:hypothetical protein